MIATPKWAGNSFVRVFIDRRRPHQPLKARFEICHRRQLGMENFYRWWRGKKNSAQALTRGPPERLRDDRTTLDRMAPITGVVSEEKQKLNWIGVALPLGKGDCEQMRGSQQDRTHHEPQVDGDIRRIRWSGHRPC